MLPTFSHQSLPSTSNNSPPQCLTPIQDQHQTLVSSSSNQNKDQEFKQQKTLRPESENQLTKVSKDAFMKFQKRKLKQLYPIFVQSEIELVAKRMWNELTEEEKEIHQRKNENNIDFDAESIQNWHIRMKLKSNQNIEPFSSEEFCNNEETDTKNQNGTDLIFQQKCPIKPNQQEEASHTPLLLDSQPSLKNNSSNEIEIVSSQNQSNLENSPESYQIINSNDQTIQRDILDFQQSSILEIDGQPPNFQAQSNRQLDESLQNETKTSSAIYENSNQAVVGTFQTFTLISLTQMYRSEPDQPQSIGNNSITSDSRGTQRKNSKSIKKEDELEPDKAVEGNKGGKGKDRFLCDNQDIQNVEQTKNSMNQPK